MSGHTQIFDGPEVGAPGPQASPRTVEYYRDKLRELLVLAESQGVILTIDVRPRLPLMMGGSLFASCCGLFSRFHRGGRGPLFVRVCARPGDLGTPLVGVTYRRRRRRW